ncbi:hypothetical protein A9B99_09260 [Mangrovibacter phragmitis]|uniref:Uncharacterized protein n=1 Tax=Mangrovibacter phragmitis TaxID=1691903 RepID=A0A1B7L2J8_9ENTR|nr:hypothetical protein A9B99_09260 [Mangrovibacter phragmitis]
MLAGIENKNWRMGWPGEKTGFVIALKVLFQYLMSTFYRKTRQVQESVGNMLLLSMLIICF